MDGDGYVTESGSDGTERAPTKLPGARREQVVAVLRDELARAVSAALERGTPPDAVHDYLDARAGRLRSRVAGVTELPAEDVTDDPGDSLEIPRVVD
jgi:hypothetical protein